MKKSPIHTQINLDKKIKTEFQKIKFDNLTELIFFCAKLPITNNYKYTLTTIKTTNYEKTKVLAFG